MGRNRGLWTLPILLFSFTLVIVDCASLSNVVNIACRRNPKLRICSPSRQSNSAEDFPDSDPPPLPPIRKRSRGNPLLSVSRLPGNLTRSEYLIIKQLAAQTRRVRNPFSDEDNVLLDQDIIDFKKVEFSGNADQHGKKLPHAENEETNFKKVEFSGNADQNGRVLPKGERDENNFSKVEFLGNEDQNGRILPEAEKIENKEENDEDNFSKVKFTGNADQNGKELPTTQKIENKEEEGIGGLSWHKQDGEEEPDTVLTRGGNFAHSPEGEGQSRVDKYCEKYQENYAYYCADSIDKTPALKSHLVKFCPSFEANCPEKIKKKPTPSKTIFIPEPTAAIQNTNTEAFPDVANVEQSPEEIAAEDALAKLKKTHPCKPNCDQRRFKHCTAECKCDYLYPYVQRFCNPPPMPFFLNTCRLWYYSCPKYQQYHYSSQFVYSKAEKGKTIGGAASGTTGVGSPAAAVLPGPAGGVGGLGGPLIAARGDLTRPVKAERAKIIATHKPTNPFETIQQQYLVEQNIRPKARQTGTAAVGGAGPTFGSSIHDFDNFSDRRGQVLRARSRSPFSKPGLWEPNPDDPHNRDHANKWYYRPSSVGADWLSGQVTWGAHWAVPAAGVGGTDGFSALHFPTIGNFLNIADDYD